MPSPREDWLAENPIRLWRLRKEQSQQTMAESIDTAMSRLSDWECGIRHPRWGKITALAALMGVDAPRLDYKLRIWAERNPAKQLRQGKEVTK